MCVENGVVVPVMYSLIGVFVASFDLGNCLMKFPFERNIFILMQYLIQSSKGGGTKIVF